MKINKIKIFNSKIISGKEDMLPDEFVKRIINYKERLKEVEVTALEDTIKDFNDDMYPEIELCIWENIAEKYEKSIKSLPNLDIEGKKGLFKKLLQESFDR
jgi:hypothetical protein